MKFGSENLNLIVLGKAYGINKISNHQSPFAPYTMQYTTISGALQALHLDAMRLNEYLCKI